MSTLKAMRAAERLLDSVAHVTTPGDTVRPLHLIREAIATREARRADILTVLTKAEAFIAGFEGDELQEGVDELLVLLRAVIARATRSEA